jgi:Family of unknown function (DUF6714)
MTGSVANFSDAEANSIIEEIRDAFRDVPRGPLSLHQAIVKTWTDDNRVTEVGALDTDTHWSQIRDIDIQIGAKALYGADPESWRYLIPAFMIWTLRFFRANNAFTSDQTIYTFDPHRDDLGLHAQQMKRYQMLTPTQSRAISRFLTYMAAQHNAADSRIARKALDEYWGQFFNH